jgi:hypothetical protein
MKEIELAMADKDILLYAGGDIGPYGDHAFTMFQHITGLLKQADFAFCQLEVNLSNRGAGPHGHENARNPVIAEGIKQAGFNIVSFAGNHCLDSGTDAFLDTIENLKAQDLNVIGVGHNIVEARTPAIIEKKGTKVAFLAYNSVVKDGYAAENDKLGCAPLRAWTLYEPIEKPGQPGIPARAYTFSYREDMKAMIEDIRKAKNQADIVIVSMHSGVHITPAVIADYQKEYAYAAIDAGADLILQHHAHILKGIEMYEGKAIFYGLSNYGLEIDFMTKEWANNPKMREIRKAFNPDWNPPYDDYPDFPFPPDARMTIIVKCVMGNKAIKKVSFLPAIINNKAEPEVLAPADKRFAEVCNYMEDISKDQGLNFKFSIEGDEVVVQG